jgi:dynein assembly factor 1
MSTTELDRALHDTVLKREAVKEKAFREQRAKLEEEFHNELGMGGSEMTKAELKKIVDSDRRMYYRTEELNDKLYIHYKGWRELQNLEGWTGLKTLYGECNAFSYIQGLQTCTQLRSLFLQENCIKQISGLENLTQLWSLNLSSNFIERIEGLSACKNLNTLIIAKNKIGFGGLADIEQLVESSVCSLDLQDNRLEDPDILPEVFSRMADLRVLYLKGNPAAKKIVNYRKSLTVYCKELRYIDDRPVFEDDRRCAEAFNRGGIEEERAEKRRIKEEKNEAHLRNMRLFNEMIENTRREKKERDAMRKEDKYTDDTDPVESSERRQKRLIDAWKEANKEDLKDDAREYAQKRLQAEKEGKAANETQKENIDQNAVEAVSDSVDVGADQAPEMLDKKVDNRKLHYDDIWDAKSSGAELVEENEQEDAILERKEDKRKLVYEDIWDDVPQSKAGPPLAQPSAPPASLQPAGGTDVFLPWAEGAIGMDAVKPSKAAIEQRKEALRSGADNGGDEKTKPSWHSRYKEKLFETQCKVAQAQAASKPTIFAPPDRVAPVVAAPPQTSEHAVTTAPAVAGGELDEMD